MYTHEKSDLFNNMDHMRISGTKLSSVKYILKLNPNCIFLLQRLKSDVSEEAAIWDGNMVVGKNSYGQLVQIISKETQLSTVYTHHSTGVRASHC